MYIKNGSFKRITHIISYVPPFIITQPLSGAVSSGQNYTFEIKVRGSAPIRYQWYKNNFPLINQTSSKLLLSSTTTQDQAFYYCKVSNNRNYVDSDVVPLSVVGIPYISTHPLSVFSPLNTNVSLSVLAFGTEPLLYNWYKDDVLYPDSTSKNLYINNINYNNEGIYYVVVSNEYGSVTSLSASIKIIEPLVIVTQPTNVIVNVNNNAQFSLSCTSYFPVSSQWRRNGSNYGSVSSNNNGSINLNISSAQLSDIGYYDCILYSNYYQPITSNSVYLQVNEKPVFTLHPLSANPILAGVVTFTVDTSPV